jgi:hypothetical protein
MRTRYQTRPAPAVARATGRKSATVGGDFAEVVASALLFIVLIARTAA